MKYTLDQKLILEFIKREWIHPNQFDNLDEEDLRRMKFIVELRTDFEVNDEGIDIILHLIDQLHTLMKIAQKKGTA